MTGPANSRTTGNKRLYSWRDENYWSVTTIISGGLPKPALLPWGIKMVAEGAVRLADTLPALVAEDPDAAVRMLKGLPYAQRDRAADLGTLIHAATEAYVLGKPFPKWPKTIAQQMDGFKAFLKDYEPEYIATEASVYNRKQRYAGTLDAIATIDGRTLLLDMKTSKKAIYPEVALQLAAYRFAEFIGLPDGSESPMHPVSGCAALRLCEDGTYELLDVRADREVFQVFLYARETFRWIEETSKGVLLGPLARMKSEADARLADAVAS